MIGGSTKHSEFWVALWGSSNHSRNQKFRVNMEGSRYTKTGPDYSKWCPSAVCTYHFTISGTLLTSLVHAVSAVWLSLPSWLEAFGDPVVYQSDSLLSILSILSLRDLEVCHSSHHSFLFTWGDNAVYVPTKSFKLMSSQDKDFSFSTNSCCCLMRMSET